MTQPTKDQTSDQQARVSRTSFAERHGVEEGSVEHIYLEHAFLLRRVAVQKFRVPEEDAETLVQDVFLSYLVHRAAVRSNLRAYLVSAICKASCGYWRSRKTKNRVFSDDDLATLESAPCVVAEDFVDGLSAALATGATLATLGSRCSEALRRYYVDGEDTRTLALAFNTTPQNVGLIMHRCRKNFRAAYAKITQARQCNPAT